MKIRLTLITLIFITSIFGQNLLDNILSPSKLPYLKNSKLIQISSYDTTGKNSDYVTVPIGKTQMLAEMEGPGVIARIWVTIASRDPFFLRRILLRMYWDDETNPSVEVPIGDFFGTGFEYKHHLAQYVGMSSGGYYCYFPMPFNKSARVEIVNETGSEINSFYYHIDYQKLYFEMDKDVAYFHANWRREVKTDPDKNYLVLNAEGNGHFVGCNLSMQSYNGQLWFLEGDEMIYVDGEKFPSIYGTGTEDYLTGGWYFRNGEFSHPYHGLIIKDEEKARIAAYRFHIGDVIPFKNSIKFTIEHGHNNLEVGDYSSTAYWYQMEPHKPFEKMLKAGQRIPLQVVIPDGAIEGENIVYSGESETTIEDMSDNGVDWSNNHQLKIETDNAGQSFKLKMDNLIENEYEVDLYFTKGLDYGNAEIYYAGNKVTDLDGYSSVIIHGGKLPLGVLKTKNQSIELDFKISGKSEASTGFNVGVDAFNVVPVRHFIDEWMLIGPFPNPKNEEGMRLGLDNVYPPEEEIDYSKAYELVKDKPASWQLIQPDKFGSVNLRNYFTPSELMVSYAVTYIYSEKDTTAALLLGTDDGAKVLLNDEEIYKVLEVRIGIVDQDEVKLNLKKGWNKLMLKVENNLGGYNFFARIIDPSGAFKISTEINR